MELTENTVRILKAAEGHKLTQAGDVEPACRQFVDKVCLAVNAPADSWREITEEEAARMEEECMAQLERISAAKARKSRRAELEAELEALKD